MTKEEAIDVLKLFLPSTCSTDLCETVEIAIQTLSAEPTGKTMNNYAEEYITKATAQEVVKDVFRVDTITQEVIDTCMKCMTAIKNAPSTDVRKNVKGQWLDYCDNPIKFYFDGRYSAHCSVCGYHPEYEEEMHSANFCPNCGADMRGEQCE